MFGDLFSICPGWLTCQVRHSSDPELPAPKIICMACRPRQSISQCDRASAIKEAPPGDPLLLQGCQKHECKR